MDGHAESESCYDARAKLAGGKRANLIFRARRSSSLVCSVAMYKASLRAAARYAALGARQSTWVIYSGGSSLDLRRRGRGCRVIAACGN